MRNETIPTKEEMCDKIIQKYGFENEWTIFFFELAEKCSESQLFNAFVVLMSEVVLEDE